MRDRYQVKGGSYRLELHSQILNRGQFDDGYLINALLLLRLRVGKLILGILMINSFYWNKFIKFEDLEFQMSTFSTGLFRRFFQFHLFKDENH